LEKKVNVGETDGEKLVPFLKWAGGKRWLAPSLDSLRRPQGKYFEPFLGGGAMYFALEPRRAVLADMNGDLIDTYRCIRDHPAEVESQLKWHADRHSDDHYYEVRQQSPRNPINRAARFIYLNRTCWNGLYRVNQKGTFNVPRGTKDAVLMSTDKWTALAQRLSSAALLTQDFEETISCAQDGDVIFADPPYTVKHNLNGFLKYNESIFSWEDQVRLCHALTSAADRGVTVVLTNAAHSSVRDLYRN
jgi:DNA adenine methylase